MYEEHFNLSGAPFKLNPDPKFFFGSRSHNKAMAYLHYGLKQAEGFIVITGPIGSGKTMVISQLLDQLTSTNVIAAQLLTSNIAPEELLDHILSAFRIEPEGEGRTGKLEAFEDYLFDQLNRGRRVLLIMDEAQNLPFETLEELRMLSNIDYDGTPLFQVFLVGQPEFRDLLQTQRLEQLRQRVIASYHLENLTAEETREYILHRLAIAGWQEDPTFTAGALKAIHEETGGRPRRIHTVCNRIMLYCSLEDAHEVTEDIATLVIGELHEEELDARDAPHERMPAVKPIEDEKPAEEASDAADLQPETEDEDGAPEQMATDIQENEKEAGDMSTEDNKDDATPAEDNEDSTLAASGDNDKTADDTSAEPAAAEDEAAAADVDKTAAGDETADEQESVDASVEIDASAEDVAEEAEAQPQPAPPPLKPGDGSVLDRIRAKRPSRAADENRSEATLEDVAAAIAGAKVGEPIEGDESDEDVAPPIAPLKSVQSKEWRKQVRDSIDETRGELKDAHASVRRLRKSLVEIQRRKNSRREFITASLQRAEALLDQVRKDLFN